MTNHSNYSRQGEIPRMQSMKRSICGSISSMLGRLSSASHQVGQGWDWGRVRATLISLCRIDIADCEEDGFPT